VLSTTLDADDVEAFCRVSVEHTGVRGRRYFSRRAEPDAFVSGRPTDDGRRLRLHRWSSAGDTEREVDVLDGLAELGCREAGVRLIRAAGLLETDGRGVRFTDVV